MVRATIVLLLLSGAPAWAQGRGPGGMGGAGKADDEPKLSRFEAAFRVWLDPSVLEDRVREVLSRSKAVTNVEVDAAERRATVTYAAVDSRDVLDLEELLAKHQVPAALLDPARYLFQLRSGQATTDEIRTLLKTAIGGEVEAAGGGRFVAWTGPADLSRVAEAASKLKVKLDCLSHARFEFEVAAPEGKSPDPAALEKALQARRGVLEVKRSGPKFVLLVLRPAFRIEDAEKLAKAAGFGIAKE